MSDCNQCDYGEMWKEYSNDKVVREYCPNCEIESLKQSLTAAEKKALEWGEHARESQKAARVIEKENAALSVAFEACREALLELAPHKPIDIIDDEDLEPPCFCRQRMMVGEHWTACDLANKVLSSTASPSTTLEAHDNEVMAKERGKILDAIRLFKPTDKDEEDVDGYCRGMDTIKKIVRTAALANPTGGE